MKLRILYWIPRIFTILAILFMMMFSLDVFGSNESTGRKLPGLLIHNIPVLILTGILVIAWIWEVAGGILFILAFIAASIFYKSPVRTNTGTYLREIHADFGICDCFET